MRTNETWYLMVVWPGQGREEGPGHYLGVPYGSLDAVTAAYLEASREDQEAHGDNTGSWFWLSVATDEDNHPAVPHLGVF